CKGKDGCNLEIKQSFNPYPAHTFKITNFCNTNYKGREYQRCNDHFNEPKENIAEHLHILRKKSIFLRKRMSHAVDITNSNACQHPYENTSCQSKLHKKFIYNITSVAKYNLKNSG